MIRFLFALLSLAACLLLASCGGSSHRDTGTGTTHATNVATDTLSLLSSHPAVPLDTPVATVGTTTITWGTLRHTMAIGSPTAREVPEPPTFASCVARLATAKSPGISTPSQRKEKCRQRYEELLRPALASLINGQWLSSETTADGMHVNATALVREMTETTRGHLKQIAASGQTLADVRRNLLLTDLVELLYARIKNRIPLIDHAFLSRYYAAHKRTYFVPETRDIHIVRTASAAAAQKVRREVESGRSFASVAQAIHLPQPILTKHGTLLGLRPHFFSEPPLNDAIFRARPHVLSGPVRISLGYYVFEVIKTTPPHQIPLDPGVEAELKRQLPEQLYNSALVKAVAAFRAKWTARTSCRPGYIVEGCRQYRRAPSSPPPDPYTF